MNVRYKHLTKENGKTTLLMQKKHVHFSYDQRTYMQVDGGLPLGLVLCKKYIYDRTRNCDDTFVNKLLTKLERIYKKYIHVYFT